MGKKHRVVGVVKGSIAEEMGVEEGDALVELNHQPVLDAFDYRYHTNGEFVTVLLQKGCGGSGEPFQGLSEEQWELEIEKEEDEDLGMVFESDLMDGYRSCRNRCIFCFIDQMPPGLRETLYFKDDDARLSFLNGNYITLTNLGEDEVERIVKYRLMPVNISVHTTNVELRNRMLDNRFAGAALQRIRRLYDARIEMNSQIVLCKGYNDGEELAKTMEDLAEYLPYMRSLSVVPVGLTKYREGLTELEPFDKKDAEEVLGAIHAFQEKCMARHDTRFVYAGDEWYITAGWPIPDAGHYEDFPQLENGVGMVRNFLDEFEQEWGEYEGDGRRKHVTLVTGVAFAPFLRQCVRRLNEKFRHVRVDVAEVANRFFGERITVTGLLVGRDVVNYLQKIELGDEVYIPDGVLRSGEDVFLDDLSVKDVESALQKRVRVVKSDGITLLRELIEGANQ